MSVKEDQIDSAKVGGLNASVFDEENHERRSWKFFNSRLPRSEVVYFTQILIIFFLIVVSLTKLVFSQLDCKESTFWFSLLSCTIGYALPNPKLCTILYPLAIGFLWLFVVRRVVKKQLIFQMLLRNTFYPTFRSIYYFYQHEQPNFSTIERKVNIFFTKFSGFEFISQLENSLLVFDDSCEEIFNDKEFSKLATAGRHRNISVIYLKRNLFQQSKWSRTIDLNTTHIILFKSPRDIQQITYVGKQLNKTNVLKESYEFATKQPFGHLLIDLDPKT